MTIFVLLDNFSSKFQEDFSKHEIRVFLQTFLILQIWDKPELLLLKKFQKHFWKLDSISNKPRIFGFRKIPCGLIPKLLNNGFFSVFGIFSIFTSQIKKKCNTCLYLSLIFFLNKKIFVLCIFLFFFFFQFFARFFIA
jgi:hypothetical protein